uniref:tyrosine-type recombinase/integrase n=1 Tax=Jeotgalibaca porci TaxID=1868793 RepID=UPI00359F1A80
MFWKERSNGTFIYGEWYKDPYTNERKRTHVTLKSNSKQAQNKAQKLLNAKIEEILNKSRTEAVPFRVVKNEWYEGYKGSLRPSSIRSTNSAMKIIDKYFNEKILIDKLDARFIQKFFNSIDYSEDYIGAIKSILNQVFEYAEDKGMVKQSPMHKVKIIKKAKTLDDLKRVEEKYLEQFEAEALIDELYRRPNTYRLGRLAEFLYLMGTRIGEAVILKPFDIDDDIVRITGTIDTSKGYKRAVKGPPKTLKGNRDISMTQRTIDLVKRTTDENKLDALTSSKYIDQGFIFVTKSGTPIQTNSFNLALKKAGARVGIRKELTSHIFRHTHVSILAEMNIPLKVIMDRIGHEDEKITNDIYTHITNKMKITVIDKLESYGL